MEFNLALKQSALVGKEKRKNAKREASGSDPCHLKDPLIQKSGFWTFAPRTSLNKCVGGPTSRDPCSAV